MEFLYFLEGIRTPILTAFMGAITYLGDEMIFLALAMIFLWCVDKHEGYYLLALAFLGTQINQLLKVVCKVPRPWVRDPNFKAVESAIPAATGYSFPSGHTQNSVGTFGGLALWNKQKWIRIPAIVLCILIPFSRMYLGVHTPADVLTSAVIALVLVFGIYPIIQKAKEKPHFFRIFFGAMILWSIGQVVFMELYLGNTQDEVLLHGLENAYKMLGAVLGFGIAYELDQRWIRYETKACWWVQLIKVIPGAGLALGTKSLVRLLLPEGLICQEALPYFFMVLVAAAAWPATFKFWNKLAQKQ